MKKKQKRELKVKTESQIKATSKNQEIEVKWLALNPELILITYYPKFENQIMY
jgi:hypothetical protein